MAYFSDFVLASREPFAGVLLLKFQAMMSWSSRLPGFTRRGRAACTLWPEWSPWQWWVTPATPTAPSPVGRRERSQESPASRAAPAGIPSLPQPLPVSSAPPIPPWMSTPKSMSRGDSVARGHPGASLGPHPPHHVSAPSCVLSRKRRATFRQLHCIPER